jgi:hypothetical protein
MATVLEIIQGINQAAANAWDGSHEESLNADGRARKVGLKREEGHIINDKRVSDGFKVRFSGPNLTILYQSETRLKEVAQPGFENEISGMIGKIASFLKKEYKAITGNGLTLTKIGEPSVFVQKLSNYRTDVCATCDYKIGGIGDVAEVKEPSEDRLDKAVKDWLSQGRKEATYAGGNVGKTRPKNDTRKGNQ